MDSKYSTAENLVFNRTVTLSDSWAKKKKAPAPKAAIAKTIDGNKITIEGIKLVQLSKKQYKKANVSEGNEPVVLPNHLKTDISDLEIGKTFSFGEYSLEVSAFKDENIISLPGKIIQGVGKVADKNYTFIIDGSVIELR